METFFKTTAGVITAVTLCAGAVTLLIGALRRRGALSVRALTASGVAVALSASLSEVRLFRMPQGGSVTPCSMIFIALVGYWFGPLAGILAGVADGLLSIIITAPSIVHPVQIIMDYPLAFAMLGFCGFIATKKPGAKYNKYRLYAGMIIGVFGRWLMSFLSGFIFFSEYATGNPVIYSAVYNASYMLPELLIILVIISIPPVRGAIDYIGKT